MDERTKAHAIHVAEQFAFEGKLVTVEEFGDGHINDTYRLIYDTATGEVKYILQHMNRIVFPDPVGVMENIMGVTAFLKEKIKQQGGDPIRETLTVISAKDGKPYSVDEDGEYWRAYVFISNTNCYNLAPNTEIFYESAYAFGNFQSMLSDYPAETLHETIVDFHNTKARFATFKKAVEEDVCGRAAGVRTEIQFVLDREADAVFFTELQEKGELPIRVTHNDTKLNNVLLDANTDKGLCVIDLDTVMPGLAMNDFGDSIRSGASTAEEDEQDLSKVSCDMDLFDIYAKGFIEGCQGKLTAKEIELLPMGAKIMTYECGMRFLADYLQGDVYFKIHRDGQNLDRCRTQFKLVADMEDKWQIMQNIVKKYQ